MIVIIDYGMGNIHSVARALKAARPDMQVILSKDPQKIKDATHLVLPGQGAMPDCMKALQNTNLVELLMQEMQKKPTMGVCVGMQMLFDHSEEGNTAGLGILKGRILKFPKMRDEVKAPAESGLQLKVPHMGWNQAQINLDLNLDLGLDLNHTNNIAQTLWHGINPAAYFYFVHSYYLPLDNPHTLTTTDYGFKFSSSVLHEQLFATQFHPEKSGTIGLKLYQNFLNI